MKDIYQWIYDRYVLPKLRNIAEDHDAALTAFAERAALPQKTRLRLHDMVDNMRVEWGTEAFVVGVRFGLRLNQPRTRSREPGWLTDFLP